MADSEEQKAEVEGTTPEETTEQSIEGEQVQAEDQYNGEEVAVAEGEDDDITEVLPEITEEQAEVTEEQTVVMEEQAEVAEEQTEVTEEQTEVTEEQTEAAEEQTEVTEEQAEVTEEQTEVTEEQTEVTEEQTEVTEEQTEVAEEQTEVTEENVEATEVVVTNGDMAPDDLDLSEDKKAKLREVFELYATDDVIDYKGFKNLVRCFGQNPLEVECREWYNSADQNQDGQINFNEFCRLFLQYKEPEEVLKAEIMNCVKRLFPNQNEEIELKKIIQIMSKLEREASDLNQEDIQRYCEEMDINGNGKVDAAEFVSSLCGSGVSL